MRRRGPHGNGDRDRPRRKAGAACIALPEVALRRHDRFERFMQEARTLPPLLTAIVHPCNGEAIQAAIEARNCGLITPVPVGPEHKIHMAAEKAGLSIAGLKLKLVATEHSHAAAAHAVELAATGEVEALMKGSLHTDELLSAAIATSRLRTERRTSHVYVFDVPTYPKPLIITNAAINIAPTLESISCIFSASRNRWWLSLRPSRPSILRCKQR
jgi:phosphate acetyltransferase